MHVRMRELANLFPSGCPLIDVGSDHGHLGILLLREGKTSSVFNIDLSRDAMDRCRSTYRRLGYEGMAHFLVNDGFSGLKDLPEDGVAVIAGLGSHQILRILGGMPEALRRLMLLSHTDYYPLRRWAEESSFSIEEERYVDDGETVYLIVVAVRRGEVPRAEFLEHIFGREEFRGRQPDLFRRYWARNVRRILNIPEHLRSERHRATIRFLEERGIL